MPYFDMVIGLTGGICSGKTTISKVFENHGAVVIDLDSLGHYILKNDLFVYEQLLYSFGAGIINSKNEIDRAKLGRLVFANPDYLTKLNNIVHPPMIKFADEKIKFELSKNKAVVLDAALLIECGMAKMVDFVVIVYAKEETQVQRLINRGFSKEEALGRIRSQLSFEEKKLYADFIINNDGLPSEAIKQAEDIWAKIENSKKANPCLVNIK